MKRLLVFCLILFFVVPSSAFALWVPNCENLLEPGKYFFMHKTPSGDDRVFNFDVTELSPLHHTLAICNWLSTYPLTTLDMIDGFYKYEDGEFKKLTIMPIKWVPHHFDKKLMNLGDDGNGEML